jgi:uracil-DNA glycosylase
MDETTRRTFVKSGIIGGASSSVTDLAKSWRTYWPEMIPLPHPSPRNNIGLRRNPWLEAELLPSLRKHASEVIAR